MNKAIISHHVDHIHFVHCIQIVHHVEHVDLFGLVRQGFNPDIRFLPRGWMVGDSDS